MKHFTCLYIYEWDRNVKSLSDETEKNARLEKKLLMLPDFGMAANLGNETGKPIMLGLDNPTQESYQVRPSISINDLTFISDLFVYMQDRVRLEAKVKRMLNTLLPATVVLSNPVLSFHGKRTGFVLSGGVGIAPVGGSTLRISEIFLLEGVLTPPIVVDKAGIAADVVIGYAWDERNVFALETKLIRYASDSFCKRRVIQGFVGPVSYHYLQPQGSSLFTALGIGLFVFDIQGFDAIDPGEGLMVGAGYQFARYIQIAGYFSYGNTSEKAIRSGKDVSIKHKHLSVLISVIAI